MSQGIQTLSDEQLKQTVERLERYAKLYDSQFRIPFTRFRIGLDGIIGLIPVVGESVGAILSLYLLLEAFKLKVPNDIKLRMVGNVVLDWFLGLIPIFGDLADIAYKANIRNFNLLLTHVEAEQARRQPLEKSTSKRSVLLYLAVTLLIILFSTYLLMFLNQA